MFGAEYAGPGHSVLIETENEFTVASGLVAQAWTEEGHATCLWPVTLTIGWNADTIGRAIERNIRIVGTGVYVGLEPESEHRAQLSLSLIPNAAVDIVRYSDDRPMNTTISLPYSTHDPYRRSIVQGWIRGKKLRLRIERDIANSCVPIPEGFPHFDALPFATVISRDDTTLAEGATYNSHLIDISADSTNVILRFAQQMNGIDCEGCYVDFMGGEVITAHAEITKGQLLQGLSAYDLGIGSDVYIEGLFQILNQGRQAEPLVLRGGGHHFYVNGQNIDTSLWASLRPEYKVALLGGFFSLVTLIAAKLRGKGSQGIAKD